MNVAQMCGPSIGGALYGVGGFYLPFAVMGAIQVTMSLLSIPLLPECRIRRSQESRQRPDKKITVRNMLRIPRIWFSFSTFIVATICNGFLSVNLEPQVLRRFELTPFYVGVLFGLKDGANSIASPVWGYLCDKCRKRTVKPYIIGSATLAATSFFLLGSSNVIGIHLGHSIYLVTAALIVNGVAIGGEQVAGIVDALHEAINADYPDDPNMHGLIAGLWSSLSGAGRFVSRSLSGFLIVWIGFDKTAAVATALQCVVALATLLYFLLCECSVKSNRAAVQWNDTEDKDKGEIFIKAQM